MNLHFFYEGSLGREEAASAFLATMLEHDFSKAEMKEILDKLKINLSPINY